MNVCYYVAYVVFQIPGMLLLSRPSLARWLLPTLEILWGVATFGQSRVTNIKQLYACRFRESSPPGVAVQTSRAVLTEGR